MQQFEGTSSAIVTNTLDPGVYFWRVWGQRDGVESAQSSAVWEFFVGAENAAIPSVVGAMMDVNCDGFADVAIASGGPVEQQGFVEVYEGGNDGLSMEPVVTLRSASVGDGFAISVANAGDVNGDGYSDVIVGASRALLGGDAPGATGRAFIYLGSARGLSATFAGDLQPLANTQRFGYVVAGAGDVNADGYADVVALSDNAVTLYLGSGTGLLAGGFAASRRPRATDEVRMLAPVADVDFDDHADFLVANDERDDAVRATLFGGDVGWLGREHNRPVLFSPMSSALSAAGLGDINGDGFADLAIGDPRAGNGRVGVFLGNENANFLVPSTALEGPANTRLFGWDVAGVGDLNGDGFDDIAISSPGTLGGIDDPDGGVGDDGGASAEDAGAVGSCQVGAVSVFLAARSGLPRQPSFTYQSTQGCDQLGFVVTSVGDVNHDTYADFIVTAPLAHSAAILQAGRAWLFHGGAPLSPLPVRMLAGTTLNQRFGWSIASR